MRVICDYQIQPYPIPDYPDATGIYKNSQGVWLGEVYDGIVLPFSDEDGNLIAAPENWKELIIEELP